MLTKHNYKPIEGIDWDNKIKECCAKEPSPDPPCTECCYDKWRAELKDVYTRYNTANERAGQLTKELGFVTDRSGKYKTWLDELTKASDLAKKICSQLELIAVQSDKIWYNACKAVEAIEVLFCMIRDFYMQVDYIKLRYDALLLCISKHTDPSLVKGQGILKYLDEYGVKLDAVIKTRDDIIKFIVDAVRISNLIRNNISTLECPDKDYDPCNPPENVCRTNGIVYYGFKTVICEWFNAFKCNEVCKNLEPCGSTTTSNGNNPNQSAQSQNQRDYPQTAIPECRLEPSFCFPICNDNYLSRVNTWYCRDVEEIKKLTNDLNTANKEKEALLACKNSLDKAIKEVDPKERCK